MAISGIKGYDVLLISKIKTLVETSDKTKYKGVISLFKFINNAEYNELILSQ